jgi:hypothetical protein
VIGVSTTAGVNRAEALEDGFIAGLNSAGVRTDGTPTAKLSITTTVVPPRGAATNQSFHFGWAADTSPSAPPIANARIVISATLMNVQPAGVAWLAMIDCTIKTNDRGPLVEDLGRNIGKMIGQTTAPGTPF